MQFSLTNFSFKDNKDLSIVLLVLFVLAMMIIPLPTELMDMIIGFNIGITIIVLMVVIYMKTTLKLTSFPSILLVLALLRIGITISTSRLILLNGDAGEIVSTFGEFVVGGNLVVGIIIFITITIINFIVITKGSERVAEVAARFSLDAMPGKQMSIDSDMRANTIDMAEATRRRGELNLESKLYGAMDGAMKFVKGDAIASIVDILINLIGGLIIGMLQHGLGFSEALQTYTMLTIGDGLVQQIPALLISLTAGIMITRVNEDKQSLGDNIIGQVFENPKALVAASILLAIMSFVPGMPKEVFLGLFILILVMAFFLKRSQKKTQNTQDKKSDSFTEADAAQSPDQALPQFESWKLAPLALNIANNLKNVEHLNSIKMALNQVKQEILMELGIEIPNILLKFNASLDNNTYQLLVHEIPASLVTIYPQHLLLFNHSQQTLSALAVTEVIENHADVGKSDNGVWIDESFKDKFDEYKLPYLNNSEFIMLNLKHSLNKHVAEFLGIQEVKNLLDKMQEYQDLIKELLRMLPLNRIAEVLQRLVAEDISIRNFKIILDAMLEWAQMEKNILIITEQVRKALGRHIAYKYSKGTYIIPCFLLDQTFEDTVRDAIRFTNSGSYLAIDPEISNLFIENLINAYEESEASSMNVPPVIVTQLDIRRYVRSIIEKRLPYLAVLSFQELDSHTEFSGLGVIEVN